MMKEPKDPISGLAHFAHDLKAFMINKRELGAANAA